MGFPALDQSPGIILLVPDLEAVVRARRDHAITKVVEINSEDEILMTVRESLEGAVCGHLCVRLTGSYKMRFEMLQDARVNSGRVAVSGRVLNQGRDQIDLLEHIFEADGEIEMRMAMMRRLPEGTACRANNVGRLARREGRLG